MKYIENEVFLHIQRRMNGLEVPLWNVGETHFIGQRKNRYFEAFDYLNADFSSDDIISSLRALGHTMRIVRELVFEEVRKEFFPSHPSRHRCLWVIKGDAPDSLKYWTNSLGKADKILKLELTGKIHVANQEYLNATTEGLNVIRQRAFHYWTGTSGTQVEEEEILFEGFAKVIEEL